MKTQYNLLEWQKKAVTAQEQQSYPQGDIPGAQKPENMVQITREHYAYSAQFWAKQVPLHF